MNFTLIYFIFIVVGCIFGDFLLIGIGSLGLIIMHTPAFLKYIYYIRMMRHKPGMAFDINNKFVETGNSQKYEEMLRFYREFD